MEVTTQLKSWVVILSSFNNDISLYLKPILNSLFGLAGVLSVLFIIVGGILYMTSSANPDRLELAKKVIKNSLIGLIIVISAASFAIILDNAYSRSATSTESKLPVISSVETDNKNGGITEILLNAIVGLFKNIIESAGKPFISGLNYFTSETPLMSSNPAVLKLWLTILAIANSLFVLAVTLIGFQVMSSSVFGLEEIGLKNLLPKLIGTFLLMNSSLLLIDLVIGLSNALIKSITSAYSSVTVWDSLSKLAEQANTQGIVSLIIMLVFLILSVILMVYYIVRLVSLYVGAVLSPIIALLQLLPSFKEFTTTAIKTYVVTIFVLFVHVIILTLAASLFDGLSIDSKQLNPLMTTLIGIATLFSLLKTQGLLMQLTYVSIGPKALGKLGSQFINGVSAMTAKSKTS